MTSKCKVKKPGSRSGRPALDYITLSEEILAWSALEDSIILRAWAALKGITQEEMIEYAHASAVFSKAYRVAQNRIGVRRELLAIKQGTGTPYNRYAAVHDKVLDQHERDIRAESKGGDGNTQVILIDKGSLDSKQVIAKLTESTSKQSLHVGDKITESDKLVDCNAKRVQAKKSSKLSSLPPGDNG